MEQRWLQRLGAQEQDAVLLEKLPLSSLRGMFLLLVVLVLVLVLVPALALLLSSDAGRRRRRRRVAICFGTSSGGILLVIAHIL